MFKFGLFIICAATMAGFAHDPEGLITFDLQADTILNHPIEGNGVSDPDMTLGGLVKGGPAMLKLTGENRYAGRTIVKQGELQIDGSILNTIEVRDGARLSGSFKIYPTQSENPSIPSNQRGDLINFGTLSPGIDTTGEIEIPGNFINHSTATLQIHIKPSAGRSNDALKILGNGAMLNGGKLELYLHPGNYIAGTEFKVIDGTTFGEFDTIQLLGPLAGQLDFKVTYGSLIATVLNNRLFEDQIITASHAREVVSAISAASITPGSDLARILQELGAFTNAQVNRALCAISPSQYGALEWINARNNSYIANILSQYQYELCCSPRDCCCCLCRSNIWITGFGNLMNNHKWFDHLRPYQANSAGVLAGMDYLLTPCVYLGTSVGYTRTHLDWKNHGGGGNSNSYYGALYGIFKGSYLNLDLSVIGGATDYGLNRHLRFGTIDRRAKSDFWAWFVTSHLGLRFNWECSCFNLEPFAVVDYHYFRREGFNEHNAGSLNLSIRSKTQNILRAEGGLKGYCTMMFCRSCLAPYLGLSYVGEFPLDRSKQKGSFTEQTGMISVTSYDSIVHLGSGEAGMKWTHCNGFSFIISYKGLFNTKTSINAAELHLEKVF